jgi:hypothetical protein
MYVLIDSFLSVSSLVSCLGIRSSSRVVILSNIARIQTSGDNATKMQNALTKKTPAFLDGLSRGCFQLVLAYTSLGFDLSAEHVLRERTVRQQPSFLDGFSKTCFQDRLECVYQRISHDREHLRLDAITHVLVSKHGHDIGQKFDIGTQHVQGRVEHPNQV